MTTALSPSVYVSYRGWHGKSPSSVRSIRPVEDPESSEASSILLSQQESDWLKVSLERLLHLLSTNDSVATPTITRLLRLLIRLPGYLPAPFIAIGDDGGIGVEWSKKGDYLYLSFGPSGDEAYWSGRNGEEWEADLAHPPDKLFEVLQELTLGQE